MKTAITTAYYLALAIIIASVITLLLTIFPVSGTDYDLRVVQSGSMEPALGIGSLILISPGETYTEGDIITFRRAGQTTPTTHRIVASRVENDTFYFTTKGDANETPDMEPVRLDEILGQVRLHLPWLGYIIETARTPWGFTILIIIPAAAIIGDEIRKIWRQLKSRH